MLVDGYFWTRTNLLALTDFLYRYRDLIASFSVIPGYAGELLIEPRSEAAEMVEATSSEALAAAYTRRYYLTDCGGWDTFQRGNGQSLEDRRLAAVASLAEAAPVGRAVDLGCGRGEVALHLARLGNTVLAVDYSADAVEIARTTVAAAGEPARRVEFRCEDVKRVALDGRYELMVASDLVEHLAPEELEQLYRRVAAHLAPDGLFVVHTYPNRWLYDYDYTRRRRLAQRVGAYLSAQPRTRYEELMHINEQRPQVLRRQLQRHFPHVMVWFAARGCQNPGENLCRPFSRSEMRAAADLFALAAHSELDMERVRRALLLDDEGGE